MQKITGIVKKPLWIWKKVCQKESEYDISLHEISARRVICEIIVR